MKPTHLDTSCDPSRYAGLIAAVVATACSIASAQQEEVEIKLGPVLDLSRVSSQHHVYPVDLRLAERYVREVPDSFLARGDEFGIAEAATADMLPWWMVSGDAMPRPIGLGSNWVDLRVASELSGGNNMTIHGPELTRIESRVEGEARRVSVPDPEETGLAVFVDPVAREVRVGTLLRAAAAEERRRILSLAEKRPNS